MSTSFRTLTNDSGQVILDATEPATRYNSGTGYHVASYRPSDGVEAAAYGALAGNRRPAFGPDAPQSQAAENAELRRQLAEADDAAADMMEAGSELAAELAQAHRDNAYLDAQVAHLERVAETLTDRHRVESTQLDAVRALMKRLAKLDSATVFAGDVADQLAAILR